MRLKPTGRALEVAPLRFVSLLAIWAGLARVALVLGHDANSFGFGLVLNVGADFAMIPCFVLVAYDGWVNLAQVYGHHIVAGGGLWLLAVLDDEYGRRASWARLGYTSC
jgi:hypothetical protein